MAFITIAISGLIFGVAYIIFCAVCITLFIATIILQFILKFKLEFRISSPLFSHTYIAERNQSR